MKRNMDLIRAILIQIEEYGEIRKDIGLADYGEEEIGRHVELMSDRDLIDASIVPAGDGPTYRVISYRIIRITWEGYEFLEASRNENAWQNAKKLCLEKTGGLTFDILKKCLFDLALKAVV